EPIAITQTKTFISESVVVPIQTAPPPPPPPHKEAGPLTPLLFKAAENDYGYRPPGLGLGSNGNLLNRTQSSPCPCNPRTITPQASLSKIGAVSGKGMDSAVTTNVVAKPAVNAKDQLALKIDKMSTIIFPTLFALFNIFYWSYYLGFG